MVGNTLTAISYNIRKAIGADRRRQPGRILDVIEELSPEIVVLQEADRRFGARQTALPMELLEGRGYVPVPFGVREGGLGWHGNAVLVRDPVEILNQEILDIPNLEPRGAVLTELSLAGRPFLVVGMHLDLSGMWRGRQTRAIRRELAARPKLPTIMMGDMNEWRPIAGPIAEFAIGYRPVLTGPSFPARAPLVKLDRIFVSDDVKVLGAGVYRSPHAVVASDHLPLWLKFELPELEKFE